MCVFVPYHISKLSLFTFSPVLMLISDRSFSVFPLPQGMLSLKFLFLCSFALVFLCLFKKRQPSLGMKIVEPSLEVSLFTGNCL